MKIRLLVLVLLSGFSSCGSTPPDAGDAGQPDAGLVGDAGVDAGLPGDAGVDAGQPADAGVDAGSLPVDAGTPPTIVTQPVTQTVVGSETATYTVVAAGDAPLSYQWKRNGVDVPGATQASYTTPPITLSDSGATWSVVVSNAAGSVLSAAPGLVMVPPYNLYAYVANLNDNDVSGFAVNHKTGAMTALAKPTFAVDGGPSAVVATGARLYVGTTNAVQGFDVNNSTGALTPIAGSPWGAAGTQGSAVVASPDGKYLYAGGGGKVFSWQVGASGTLTPVAGSPFSIGHGLDRLSAAGSFLFGTQSSTVFSFRTSAGAVTVPDVKTAANQVYDFVATPDARFAYAPDYGMAVTGFSIDPVTALMTSLPGSWTAGGIGSVRGAAISPDGKNLYVLSRGGPITQFTIGTDGLLSPPAGVITDPGVNEDFEHLAFSPGGAFLYASNTSAAPHNYLVGYSVNPLTGALTQLPATVLAGVNQQGLAFVVTPP